MIDRASRRKLIFYSELVQKMKSIKLEPHDTRLFHLLGEISTDEVGAERPMLTAIVVHKHDHMPGQGFFELARALDRPVTDEDAFWAKEVAKVFDHWGTQRG